jgi:branched-chain amino acid transport system ATP-binding protein
VSEAPRVPSETLPAPREPGNDMLGLRGLTVERGRRTVVRDVSIEIPAGEVTALLGPNGAGKSSLVLAVGGVLRLQAGSVLLDGREWANRRPERIRRAGIAIVPEGRRLLSDLTVEDNIRVATYALSADQARAGRDRALELFPEISRRLSAPARMLSGGEQQMVVLAQALVSQPRYMLIDELSLGLAPVVVNRLIPAIRAVAESGIGVLLIEQFATVALGLANHAHIMEGGQLRFSGLARELRQKPELLRSAYLLRGSNSASSASSSGVSSSGVSSRDAPGGNAKAAPADRAPHDPVASLDDSPAAGQPTRGTSELEGAPEARGEHQ